MLSKKNIGPLIIVILTILPVVVWLFALPVEFRIGSLWLIMSSLGKATGIAGFVLFSLNFLLTLRTRWLENWCGPLDRIYRIHHIVGGLAFIFLLFHPVLLALSYIPISTTMATRFLFSIEPFSLVLGKISLFLLLFFLGATFYAYKTLGHDRWKSIHQWIGLALVLGAAHALFIPGDISSIPVLKYYLFGIGLVGIISYVWRTILRRYQSKEYAYEFVSVRDLGNFIYEVTLKPVGKKMVHNPGQFAFLRIIDKQYDTTSHPFTIASSPTEEYLRFTIKGVGDYTKSLISIAPGTQCRIEGAFGHFTYTQSRYKRQVWIAGGIGVTPFLSMARFFKMQGSTLGYEIDMYYSGKTMEELVFLQELHDIAAVCGGGFRIHAFDSSTQGRLTAATISSDVHTLPTCDIFICGPMLMMDSLREQFNKYGVSNDQLHNEDFSLR